MLTEYIVPGTTVAEKVALAAELDDDDDDDDELARVEMELRILQDSAEEALARIRDMQVSHGDLAAGNMIVKGEQVVLVDFGYAAVLADVPRGWKNSSEGEDLRQLRRAFGVEGWLVVVFVSGIQGGYVD